MRTNKAEREASKKVNKKKWIILAVIVLVLLGAFVLTSVMHPLFLKHSEIKAEFKEKFDPMSDISFVLFGSRSDVKVSGKFDTDKLGEYSMAYTFRGKKYPFKIRVVDTRPPELKVKEVTTDCVGDPEAEDFVDKVKDRDSAKVKIKDKNDQKKPGEYKYTIVAYDPSGNETEETAVLVRKKDEKAPEIADMSEVTVYSGEDYDFSKDASVKDDLDPKPKVEVDTSALDMNKSGEYTIIYKAVDRSGNEAKKERKVKVFDKNFNYQKTGKADEGKVVYLTFDDGPSENTGKILDILKKYNAKGTFFVTGTNKGYNSNIKRAFDEGNTIGLHTYTHKYSIYASESTYYDDLGKVSDMVQDITGVRTPYIRFPGGSSNTVSRSYASGIMSKLVKSVQSRGYKYYDWNVSSGDAAGNTMPVDYIISHATSGSGEKLCILFHDSSPKTTTVEALPKIIEYYKSRGYAFLPITDGTPEFHHGVNN